MLDSCRVFNYPAAAAVHIEDKERGVGGDEGAGSIVGTAKNRLQRRKCSTRLFPSTFAMALSQYGFAPL